MAFNKNTTIKTEDEKIDYILLELPDFIKLFSDSLKYECKTSTRIQYLYDLKVFIFYIHDQILKSTCEGLRNITLLDIESVKDKEIKDYSDYLSSYKSNDNTTKENTFAGISRKLIVVRKLYNFLLKNNLISKNPTVLIELPFMDKYRSSTSSITDIQIENVFKILKEGESRYSGMKLIYYKKNYLRNIALISILLYTGINISECRRLNIDDIDLNYQLMTVTRNNGKVELLYFNNNVFNELQSYINSIPNIKNIDSNTKIPLFRSIQGKRMTARGIQLLLNDICSQLNYGNRSITPTALRKTYAKELYERTGDIELVSNLMGYSLLDSVKKDIAGDYKGKIEINEKLRILDNI